MIHHVVLEQWSCQISDLTGKVSRLSWFATWVSQKKPCCLDETPSMLTWRGAWLQSRNQVFVHVAHIVSIHTSSWNQHINIFNMHIRLSLTPYVLSVFTVINGEMWNMHCIGYYWIGHSPYILWTLDQSKQAFSQDVFFLSSSKKNHLEKQIYPD